MKYKQSEEAREYRRESVRRWRARQGEEVKRKAMVDKRKKLEQDPEYYRNLTRKWRANKILKDREAYRLHRNKISREWLAKKRAEERANPPRTNWIQLIINYIRKLCTR